MSMCPEGGALEGRTWFRGFDESADGSCILAHHKATLDKFDKKKNDNGVAAIETARTEINLQQTSWIEVLSPDDLASLQPAGLQAAMEQATSVEKRATVTRYEHLLCSLLHKKKTAKNQERLLGLTAEVAAETKADWKTMVCRALVPVVEDGMSAGPALPASSG